MTINPEPEEPSTGFKVFGAVVWAALAFITFCVASFTLAQVWPYNNASIELTSDIESNVETSEGIPVIFTGGALEYTADICNFGEDIDVEFWYDSYGPTLPGSADLDLGEGDRVSSLLTRTETFYKEPLIGCNEDIAIFSPVPDEIQTGIYYRLRTNNVYHPNALASVNNVVETNVFYYAEEGVEIP